MQAEIADEQLPLLVSELKVIMVYPEGNQSQFKWHKEIDAKNMKVIASSLRQLLSKEYKVKAKFEWW